ncbi:PREDICTED: uncharacterized protein LOC108567214 [Nicrophorus vespilloides]|uniref:Uncharacterized protein LOC108567214 n=1 Tax=Nicrophorus vespilloides TaxID=110193 RepID=A0ABM1N889_NICVS|nr:PREDICTED: uncharacterized protein LOC108567214 [Nicrophorus vespilloides]
MKFLVAAFFVIALASVQGTPAARHNIKQYSEDCMESTGVDHEIVANARKGEFVEDEKLIKYCTCVYKKMNIINDGGHLHEETLVEYSPENIEKEEASKIVKKCIEEAHGESYEKKSFIFYRCYVHAAGKPVHVFKN